MDNPQLVKTAFAAVQTLIERQQILAGHDCSDGGLITTLLEMAFSGNCGLELNVECDCNPLEYLFAEELGLVIECANDQAADILTNLQNAGLPAVCLGATTAAKKINLTINGQQVLSEEMQVLRAWWEETSYQLECLQTDKECADEEKAHIYDRQGPSYTIPFTPEPTAPAILQAPDKPRVAILRDEGSNSDREMSSAFYAAGFEPWDVCMNDLLQGTVDLERFRGIAAVGGFSYADVPDSAKGWAATILYNDRLKQQFDAFYKRPDTFTLGVCNGCQLFGLLGWVPWQGLTASTAAAFCS